MRFATMTMTILLAIVLLITGCSKDEQKPAETAQTADGEINVVITNAVIDSFIRVFPEVQEVVEVHRSELEQHSSGSPVDEVKTNEIMEEIEAEMAEQGLNQDWFFAVYQKIITAGMYMNSVRQAESLQPENIQMRIDQMEDLLQSGEVPPEQRAEFQNQLAQLTATKQQVIEAKAQLQELKANIDDPATPEEEKPQMQMMIQQLEQVFNPGAQLPEGITQSELEVLNANMQRIIATLEQYSPQQPPSMPQPTASS
ncbi:MAG TPA: hypothetical protein ENN75_02865 [candidate division Zixibacteria bacterium]|nr:hypothetical protein [candidate division Zixibacteria bacterium]